MSDFQPKQKEFWIYWQEEVRTYPDVRALVRDICGDFDETMSAKDMLQRPTVLYFVQHTARFETVNLDKTTLREVLSYAGRVIIVSMNPGDRISGQAAPSQIEIGGKTLEVVNFWFRQGEWTDLSQKERLVQLLGF